MPFKRFSFTVLICHQQTISESEMLLQKPSSWDPCAVKGDCTHNLKDIPEFCLINWKQPKIIWWVCIINIKKSEFSLIHGVLHPWKSRIFIQFLVWRFFKPTKQIYYLCVFKNCKMKDLSPVELAKAALSESASLVNRSMSHKFLTGLSLLFVNLHNPAALRPFHLRSWRNNVNQSA